MRGVRRSATLVLALILVGCSQSQPTSIPDTPGARLEHAAETAGLVPDPTRGTLAGSWARDTDRMCFVPADRGAYRVGALVDYGEGQSCTASGTATRSGGTVDLRFGKCRIEARFDGERIVFPAEVSEACSMACAGRTSLAALTVDHVSESVAEASTLRSPGGQPLCGG